MDNTQTNSILVFSQAAPLGKQVFELLRRIGMNLHVLEPGAEHLPDEPAELQRYDLILLICDIGWSWAESLLQDLKLSRRDIPCLLICRSTAHGLPLLGHGAAGIITAALLESAAGQQQFVHQLNRELEYLRVRRDARRMHNEMLDLRQRLQLMIDNSRDPIAIVHHGVYLSANPAWLALFGISTLTALCATQFLDLVATADLPDLRALLRQPFPEQLIIAEFRAVRPDGTGFPAALTAIPVKIDGEHCLQLTIHPVDDSDARHQQSSREAMDTDLQSGLLNEAALQRVIGQAISSAHDQQQCGRLILVSSPQLSSVTTQLSATDTLLLIRNIAAALLSHFPPPVAGGRLDSGDFVLVLNEMVGSGDSGRLHDLNELETILSALAPSAMAITFACGAAVITDETPDTETLIIRARQHQTARQRQSLAVPAISARYAMPDLVQQAVHDQNIELVFQPTVGLNADLSCIYEARFRVPLADRLVYPEELLTIVNQHGMGERLDRCVITKALETLTGLNPANLRLIINVTGNSLLSRTFPIWLAQELHRHHQNPGALIIQISELDSLAATAQTQLFSENLNEIGVAISLTHFGSCLDPYRLLTKAAVDYVRLDKSLLQHLALDISQHERLQTLVSHLQAQGVKVIAPMIEDIEILPQLWECNVNYVQGNCLQQPGGLGPVLFQQHTISLHRPDLRSGNP
jgi:multidomain signaling protein FimX